MTAVSIHYFNYVEDPTIYAHIFYALCVLLVLIITVIPGQIGQIKSLPGQFTFRMTGFKSLLGSGKCNLLDKALKCMRRTYKIWWEKMKITPVLYNIFCFHKSHFFSLNKF